MRGPRPSPADVDACFEKVDESFAEFRRGLVGIRREVAENTVAIVRLEGRRWRFILDSGR